MNVYETEKLLSEYLLFHYGSVEEIAPPVGAGRALDYAVRCITECLDPAALPPDARGLDLGCAVGRATFALAGYCKEVIGIDSSERFIEAAQTLARDGLLRYLRVDEGELSTSLIARRPVIADKANVQFEIGDATALREDLGTFDVVLAANLIDRLNDPLKLISRLCRLINPGGQLIITSPYTWLEEFTPRDKWFGGRLREGERLSTLEGLRRALETNFDLREVKELPFLIREHARKFQWSVAQATIWRRRG